MPDFNDPQSLGAQCSRCPLQHRKLVPSKGAHEGDRYNARFVILSDYPGRVEAVEGEPFAEGAPATTVLDRVLDTCGENRRGVFLTNAILCKPEYSDDAKARKLAMECCQPRLRNELVAIASRKGRKPRVLAMGKYALATLTGKEQVFSWIGPAVPYGASNGAKLTLDAPVNYLATFNPGYILRARHYGPVLLAHVARFIAWYRGKLEPWTWHEEIWEPGPRMLDALRSYRCDKLLASDTETSGLYDPITDWHKRSQQRLRLLNVGFYQDGVGVSVPWRLLTDRKDSEAQAILLEAQRLLMQHKLRVYQNGAYDMSVERVLALGGRKPAFMAHDTIVLDRIIVPSWSHKLGFQACVHTNADRWKDNFKMGGDLAGKRYERATLQDRGVYNIRDCHLTSLLAETHLKRLATEVHNGPEIYAQAMRLHRIANGMRWHGLAVNQQERLRLLRTLKIQRDANLAVIYDILRKLGLPATAIKLNHSTGLSRIFSEALQIEPLARTPTGRPKYDINVLLELAKSPNAIAARLAQFIIMHRKLEKVMTSHLEFLPVNAAYNVDLDNMTFDVEESVHEGWNPTGARTGRWSCQGYGLQTVTDGKTIKVPELTIVVPSLRTMYRGHKRKAPCKLTVEGVTYRILRNFIVGADWSQLESRIIALLSGDRKLLEWYNTNKDVHVLTAAILFGIEPSEVTPEQRELSKLARYAWQYGAIEATMHEQLSARRPAITYRDVVRLKKGLDKAHPDLVRYQRQIVREARKLGYSEIPGTERRLQFYGEPEDNKARNIPIQGYAGVLANEAVEGCVKALAIDLDDGMSAAEDAIVLQLHDAIYLETGDPYRGFDVLQDCMALTKMLNGASMMFPIDVGVGWNWASLNKVKTRDQLKDALRDLLEQGVALGYVEKGEYIV